MAAGDGKGGSDLDVFEGLGKKNSTRAPASAPRTSALPPPPPSLRNAEAQKQAAAIAFAETAAAPPPRRTAAPQPPPLSAPPQTATLPSATSASAVPAAAPSPRTPPPAPSSGRASLPPVVAPPSKGQVAPAPMTIKGLSSSPPPPVPPAQSQNAPQPQTAVPAAAKAAPGGGLDMDWDEEEEATHVLDRDGGKPDPLAVAANGFRPPPGPSAKQTLLGLSSTLPASPPPPAGARPASLPPPPPSTAQAYARAASAPPPPPPSIRPPPPVVLTPPPPAVAPPPSSQVNGGGAASGFPYQQTTTPMAMPPRVVSTRAQQAAGAAPPEEVTALPIYARSRMEATALVRPQARPTGLMVGAGAAVLVLLGLILFLMPRTGQIAVNVSDSKGGAVKNLQVSVDGKVQCDSAPCLVHNLAAGSHTVKVEAVGYEPLADRAVAVESGKDQAVDFLATPLAAAGGTGIKVAGGQPGEKLYIDDREVGSLPQEVRDLTPGTHRVRVAGGDRYAAVERSVTVTKDEFQDLGAVTLKVIKGRATVSLMTPGAKVFLVSGSDRRELPTLPMSIDLDPAKQWSLVATKPGYTDYTQALSFDDGQAEKSFVVTLDPKTASPAGGSMTFSPPPYTPPVAYVPHAAPPAAPSHPSPPPAAAAGGGGEGILNMNSIPASSVVLDGKPLGSTPQIGITVSAGTHTVLFVNADQGFKKQVSVSVAAGETKKVHP